MPQVKQPLLKIAYNNRDISTVIDKYLVSFVYTDKVAGECDEIQIDVEDTRQYWRGDWYPDKGAQLTAEFGYIGRLLPAGKFDIDEIEVKGPPDTVTIRALATGIRKALRTKNSYAHEDKTLRQIAQAIAQKHGFTVTGTIQDITIGRATQYQETDLAFLSRVAADYGHIFNVRDDKIIFSNIYDLEGAEPVTSIDITDSKSHSFKDTSHKTYKKARVKSHDPLSKSAVEANAELGVLSNGNGGADSSDTLEVRTRAENELQAECKAKAKLHKHNSKGITATITVEGNPYLVAGNNVELTGFGVLSGVYHIEQSTHTINKSVGYITEIECKRVKTVAKSKFVAQKKVVGAKTQIQNANILAGDGINTPVI